MTSHFSLLPSLSFLYVPFIFLQAFKDTFSLFSLSLSLTYSYYFLSVTSEWEGNFIHDFQRHNRKEIKIMLSLVQIAHDFLSPAWTTKAVSYCLL